MVKGRELALNVSSLYGLTGVWEYDGPSLFTVFALYKPTTTADALLAAMDEEVARIVKDGVSDAELKSLKTALLSSWYNELEMFLSRADRLAKLQALWGDANVVNKVPGWIEAVTSADVQRVARKYLTDDKAWNIAAQRLGAKDAATLDLYRKRYVAATPKRSVADEARDAAALYNVLAEIGGEKLVGPGKTLPPGTFHAGAP